MGAYKSKKTIDMMATRERLVAAIDAVATTRDRAAFAELFEYFAPRLRAYMRRLGVGDAALDDLVQEIMINVWRRASLYDPAKATVSTWVFTIARNKRIDVIRRESRPEYDPNDPSLVGEPQISPDQVASSLQDASYVRGALEKLPVEQAQVLKMSFFQDKSHSIIAEELKLPLGTVKSRMRLGMQRIRMFLEDVQ